MTKRTEAPESSTPHGFVRLVQVSKVGEPGLAMKVTAGAGDLAKIAAYLDLESLQALSAEVNLARWHGKGIRLTGHFVADVTQSCVVTLEPVEAHVEGDFERSFLPEAATEKEGREILVEPESEDPAEPLGREIDLGEILVEELSLALDPYPRKAGVEFAPEQDKVAKPANPFAVLAKLQGKAAKSKAKP